MVLLNDETKWISIRKVLNPYTPDERETYEQFELGSNGTAEVRLPTSVKDNSFHLDVSYPPSYPVSFTMTNRICNLGDLLASI